MKKILFLVQFFMTFVMMSSYGQDPDRPDLRDGCIVCQGQQNSLTVLNAYFSNSTGTPTEDICEGTGPTHITVLYSTNRASSVNNFRIFADILKKDRSNPEGDPLDSTYVEKYIGVLPSCQNGPCSFQVPISDLDLEFDCDNEFYELSNTLVVWTNSGNRDLSTSYACSNYVAAQCGGETLIPIEVGSLSYSFDFFYECIEGDNPLISFIITSLFGGNPTQPYTIKWEYELNSGEIIDTSSDFNLLDLEVNPDSEFEVFLTVSQGTLVGPRIPLSGIIPPALTYDDVIINDTIVNIDENIPTEFGSITVNFKNPENLTYFWTSADDEEFFSTEPSIDGLPEGTYKLTIIDNNTGTCRAEFFNVARILPVELVNFNADFANHTRSVNLNWATAKEWENSHFEIERSDNGIKAFQKIGEVNGMGWSDVIVDYTFEDKELPLRSGPVYYRLKQVDFNGTYAYSSTMMVRLPGVQFTQGVWRAYPNPSKVGDSFRVSLMEANAYQDEPLTLRVVNSLTATAPVTLKNESELNQYLTQIMPNAPKGLLIIELQWGNKVEHIKVMRK